jgi:hypothetical protein
MTGRASFLAPAIVPCALGLLLASAAIGVASCTTTSTTVTFGGYFSDAAPVFSIVSPLAGSCVVTVDAGPVLVPVTVDVGGTFYLRPPGLGCQYTYNCGYLQLYVDNIPNAISGTPTVMADLSGLNDPYGPHTFTVELVWDLNDGGGADTFDAGMSPEAAAPSGTGYAPPTGISMQSVTVAVEGSMAACPVNGGDGG